MGGTWRLFSKFLRLAVEIKIDSFILPSPSFTVSLLCASSEQARQDPCLDRDNWRGISK